MKYRYLLLVGIIGQSFAVNFTGDFTASASCPAYTSKNNLTNPGDVRTVVGTKYVISEANKLPAEWYRVSIAGAPENNLRWVEAKCGTVESKETTSCSLDSGKADSYVLALSLQPGFCETGGYAKGKPECLNLAKNSIYRQEFGLHGLWPNQDACGTNYGFCNSTKQQTNFCDYAPLALNSDVSHVLSTYMASYAYGSCLERHEWYKHGTCQVKDQSSYYQLAITLTHQVDETKFKNYVINNMGNTVSLDSLKQNFDASFGVGMNKKVQFLCTNGILTDLYINMPNLDKITQTNFVTLLGQAADNKASSCGSQVKISNFYVQ